MKTTAAVIVIISVVYSPNILQIVSTNGEVGVELTSSVCKTKKLSPQKEVKKRASITTKKSDKISSTSILTTKQLLSQTKATRVNLKPIPEDSDTFHVIRTQNKLFVDKTSFIRILYNCSNAFIFLTRPRGFGKSLFVQMLHEYFNGSKEYFKDTAIYDRGNKLIEDGTWVQHPIIYINFSKISAGTDKLFQRKLEKHLRKMAESYRLGKESFLDITGLIEDLHSKYKLPVYILIDEYDQPLSTCSTEKECETIAKFLSAFYTGIKSCIEHIGLLFMTGVSRWSLSQIGSGMNDYKDITFDERFSSIMGFTLEEIGTYFKPYISKFVDDEGLDYEDIRAMIFQWYGGYLFAAENGTDVLNPVSTYNCLRYQKFKRYWPLTGSMKLVISEMQRLNLSMLDFRGFSILEEDLEEMYDPLSLSTTPLAVIMYNYGYLTITRSHLKRDFVILDYPNIEIKMSLRVHLSGKQFIRTNNQLIIRNALEDDDIESFIGCLNRYGFPVYNKPLNVDVFDERAATRAIIGVLQMSAIEYKDGLDMTGVDGKLKGDIDILITSVHPKYTIEVKAGKFGAVTAILQLISYIIKNENAFRNAIYPDDTARLVGVNVKRTEIEKRNMISEWIWVPYREGKIWLNEMKASNFSKFFIDLEDRCCQNNFMNSNKFVWS